MRKTCEQHNLGIKIVPRTTVHRALFPYRTWFSIVFGAIKVYKKAHHKAWITCAPMEYMKFNSGVIEYLFPVDNVEHYRLEADKSK